MNHILKQDAMRNVSTISLDALQGSVILITGATGFIGSSLIHTLMQYNDNLTAHSTTTGSNDGGLIHILASVRDASRAQTFFAEYLQKGYLTLIEGDVREPLSYEGDVDYIIHCASNAAPREYTNDPVGTIQTNLDGTFRLLEFALAHQVKRFLYVSTIEVYGNVADPCAKGITEADAGYIDPINPRSCYPLSKKMCENACICFGKQYGLDVTIGRLSYIFGPGMKKDDSKIVSILARNAAAGEDLVLKSKGEQLRSYTYISDAVTGLLTILMKGEHSQAYNIASSLCITTIANIAYTLEELYKDKGIRTIFDLGDTALTATFSPIKDSVLSNEQLKQLGWNEQVDLRTGLTYMVEEMTCNI